jgi:hypothetical protein
MSKVSNQNRVMLLVKTIGWSRLIGALSVALIGGYLVFALAVSGVLREKNPQLALMLFPYESAALAARADQIYFNASSQASATAHQLAIAAVRKQPVNPKALRLLGFIADMKKQPADAERLVTLSSRLSRREAGAQLWLIEHTARIGTAADTLRHYDTVLRTKPDASAVLFPRLLYAIEDEDIRQRLGPYMQLNRSWMISFLNFALTKSKNLSALNALIVENGGFPDSEFTQKQTKELLARLTAEKQFGEARKLFLSLPHATPARLRSAGFDRFDVDAQFGAMGWVVNQAADAAFDWDTDAPGRRPSLSLAVAPVTTTVIATRLLYLLPGDYDFAAKLSQLERSKNGTLRWQIRCATRGDQSVFWSADTVTMSVLGALPVPVDCPVQMLEIVASGGEGRAGLEAVVSSVAISTKSM